MTGLRTGTLAALDPAPVPLDVAPELDAVAERLYADMAPLAWLDEDNGWALAVLCGGTGELFQEVDDLARDTADGPGWSSVLDLARCPVDWLPWLAQFVGVTLTTGLTDAQARAVIAERTGWGRGRRATIIAVIQSTLTGAKTVYMQERYQADAYKLAVRTITAQTPSAAATLAALVAAKPAGIVLDFATVTGQTYDLVRVNFATYALLKAAYPTYEAMRQG
jgi:hypothetical protein